MSKLKYFLDTEFIEDGKTIDLISLGLACEDGRTLYVQNSDCDFSKASDWVWRNVFPTLLHFDMRGGRQCLPRIEVKDSGLSHREINTCSDDPKVACPWAHKRDIGAKVMAFCSVEKYGKPEFWGYFADYDWVAFCQLFGTMLNLPKGFPMYCRDIKQWSDEFGDVRIPKPEVETHHALADAEWVKWAHRFLSEKSKPA